MGVAGSRRLAGSITSGCLRRGGQGAPSQRMSMGVGIGRRRGRATSHNHITVVSALPRPAARRGGVKNRNRASGDGNRNPGVKLNEFQSFMRR